MSADPYQAAGKLTCLTCGESAWPVDARWLGDDSVLATFPPACEHRTTATVYTITPSRLAPCRICRTCGADAGSDLDLCPGCRCSATTATGTRCRNQAASGGLCRTHIAQRDRRERTSR